MMRRFEQVSNSFELSNWTGVGSDWVRTLQGAKNVEFAKTRDVLEKIDKTWKWPKIIPKLRNRQKHRLRTNRDQHSAYLVTTTFLRGVVQPDQDFGA